MSTEIRLSHLVDFYYLVALDHAAKSGESLTRHPRIVEKLQNDISNEMKEITFKLGYAIRDYLYIASFAEARHAWQCAHGVIEDISEGERSRVCRQALQYSPSDDNVTRLYSLFTDFNWNSAYGGDAWGKIVESVALFETLDLISFIDHIADVYHNGGSLFDKHSAASLARLDCDITRRTMVEFLDYKRNENILIDAPMDFAPAFIVKRLSRRVTSLIHRYYVIFRGTETLPKYLQGEGSSTYRQFTNVEYLDELTLDEPIERTRATRKDRNRYCVKCGDILDYGDKYQNESYEYFCEDCYCDTYTNCYNCSDEIRTYDVTYFDMDGYCEYCHPHQCMDCDQYIAEYYELHEMRNGDLCDECYEAKMPKCNGCNSIIEKPVDENALHVYCEKCEERIAAGLSPINEYVDYKKSNYINGGLFTNAPVIFGGNSRDTHQRIADLYNQFLTIQPKLFNSEVYKNCYDEDCDRCDAYLKCAAVQCEKYKLHFQTYHFIGYSESLDISTLELLRFMTGNPTVALEYLDKIEEGSITLYNLVRGYFKKGLT